MFFRDDLGECIFSCCKIHAGSKIFLISNLYYQFKEVLQLTDLVPSVNEERSTGVVIHLDVGSHFDASFTVAMFVLGQQIVSDDNRPGCWIGPSFFTVSIQTFGEVMASCRVITVRILFEN